MSGHETDDSLQALRLVTTPHGVCKAPRGARLAATATYALSALARIHHAERLAAGDETSAAQAERRRAA